MLIADTAEEEVLLMMFLRQQEAEVFILQIEQVEANPLQQEVQVQQTEVQLLGALLRVEVVVQLLQTEVQDQTITEVEEINK